MCNPVNLLYEQQLNVLLVQSCEPLVLYST